MVELVYNFDKKSITSVKGESTTNNAIQSFGSITYKFLIESERA